MPTLHTTNGDAVDRHSRLPLLTAPVRSQNGEKPHPLVRQWRILKLLTYSTTGFTVKELAALSGMSEKTVRRDLIFLRRVGFDMSETVVEYGRKQWRIRQMPEPMAVRGSVREKYGLIHDTLADLHDAALAIGDSGLARGLKQLQEWVEGKCRGRKRMSFDTCVFGFFSPLFELVPFRAPWRNRPPGPR